MCKKREDMEKMRALADSIANLEYDIKLASEEARGQFLKALEKLMSVDAILRADF